MKRVVFVPCLESLRSLRLPQTVSAQGRYRGVTDGRGDALGSAPVVGSVRNPAITRKRIEALAKALWTLKARIFVIAFPVGWDLTCVVAPHCEM